MMITAKTYNHVTISNFFIFITLFVLKLSIRCYGSYDPPDYTG